MLFPSGDDFSCASHVQVGEWMQSEKFSFTRTDHANYLDAIAKIKGIAAAENYFNTLPPSDRVNCTYGVLLRCYCDEKMSDKALDLFGKMLKEKVITTPWPFNHLINMHIQLGQPEKAIQLGKELREAKIQPNTSTYNMLINGYSLLDDYKGMERVLTKMKSKKLCDWTTYSHLANIYLRANDLEKARLALVDLEKMCVNIQEGYQFLISFYARMSDADNVRRVWQSLKSSQPVTWDRSFLVMLRSLDKLDDVEGMKECFKEWEAVSSVWDIRPANAVISAYLRRDMLEEAELVLNSLPNKSGKSGPFFYAWEQFMLFYLEKRDLRKAMEFVETAASRARNRKWKPSNEAVDGFLKYFEAESDVSGAEEFYKLMKTMKCVDRRLYESLLWTYMIAGRKTGDAHGRIERDGDEISSELEDFIARVTE